MNDTTSGRGDLADAPAAAPSKKPGASSKLVKKRGLVAIIPVLGDLVAMARLLADREASIWPKLLVVATIAYVVCPVDLIPDAIPFFGWLDDIGVVVAARLALGRYLDPYRYPLFKKPAPVVVAEAELAR